MRALAAPRVLRLLPGGAAGRDRRRAVRALPGAVGRRSGAPGARSSTSRSPATALAVNLGLNLLLVPPYGIVGRGHRAGRRLPRDGRAHVRGHAARVPARRSSGAGSRASSGSPAALFAARRAAAARLRARSGSLSRAALVPLLSGRCCTRRASSTPRELRAAAGDPRAGARGAARVSGGAAGPRSPAQPRGPDGRGARPPVAPISTSRAGRLVDAGYSPSRPLANEVDRRRTSVSRFTKPGNTSTWPRFGPAPPEEAAAGRAGAPARVVGLEVELRPGRRPGARAPRAGTPASSRSSGRSRYRPEQHVVARRVGDAHDAQDRHQRGEQQPVVAALACTRRTRARRSRSRARSSGRSSPGRRRRRRWRVPALVRAVARDLAVGVVDARTTAGAGRAPTDQRPEVVPGQHQRAGDADQDPEHRDRVGAQRRVQQQPRDPDRELAAPARA